MTTTEFRAVCKKAVSEGSADVIIELDRPALGRNQMRLIRSRGPRGGVLGPGRTNKHTLVLFQVDMVLSWLDGKGSKVWGNPDEE